MFDHIGIRVSDIAEASRFYDAVLPTLGYGRCSSEDEQVGYGADNQPAFWLHASSETGRGTHLAFAASDRSAVADFHAAGLKAGGTDNGAPGLRLDYTPTYFAAFLIDPAGNNVEAVCTGEAA